MVSRSTRAAAPQAVHRVNVSVMAKAPGALLSLFEKCALDQDRRDCAFLVCAAGDRLALGIEPLAAVTVGARAETEQDAGLVGLVGERIVAALRDEDGLML